MNSYGSKAWANKLLKDGIRELRDSKRARAGRIVEALFYLGLLREEGFWWQEQVLDYWVHRFQRGDFG